VRALHKFRLRKLESASVFPTGVGFEPPPGVMLRDPGLPADRRGMAYENTAKRTKMVPITEDEATEIIEKLGVSPDQVAEALVEKLKRAWAL
jgi:hypothetical protein